MTAPTPRNASRVVPARQPQPANAGPPVPETGALMPVPGDAPRAVPARQPLPATNPPAVAKPGARITAPIPQAGPSHPMPVTPTSPFRAPVPT